MDILLISISVFGWVTGTAGLIFGLCSWIKLKASETQIKSMLEHKVNTTEERLKCLVHKEIQDGVLNVRDQLIEDTVDVMQNSMSVDNPRDPYSAASFRNIR